MKKCRFISGLPVVIVPAVLLGLALVLPYWGGKVTAFPKGSAATTDSSAGIRFADITQRAGIHFVHNTGAFGKRYLPETMGPGCAFLDYDNDGNPDIVLVNGSDFPGHKEKHTTLKLYHNHGNGTFTDVTARSGLGIEMYGMGVAVGDYDNDGYDDVYVTGLGEAHLFHNEHNGTFKDVTQAAGVNNTGYGASAAWFDYDKDGKLDLFLTQYVNWTEKNDIYCSLDGHHKSYCTPEAYGGETCRLFHNLGNGRFEDVTGKAGIYDPTGKSLGVAVIDFDGDGWPDLAVSNDTQPNKLYRNNHNGTFTEAGLKAGIAYSEDGIARGAMGIDEGDFDSSGRASLAIGNFSNQMIGLYHNEGNGLFIDEAPSSSIGRASLLSLSFGLFFFDYDLDGLPDLFVANGHIEPDIARIQPQVTYAQVPLAFHNTGNDQFQEVGRKLGFTRAVVARGAAYADVNNDGAPDILMTTNGGPAYLFENAGPHGHALRIKTVGTRSNRDGIGAVVRVYAGARPEWQTVHSGSSYCSESEHVLTFGLGKAAEAETVEITWPSGQKDTLHNLKAGATYTIEEGGKVLATKPFRK
ncbi:MAG TPA: CRTAC1 family protein [Terriglobia bacterium]|nr:CRTAC1 family protein [Terriglobia bacterium]